MTATHKNAFVLCRSDAGDGGWSLHAPGSTDDEIASGNAPYLVCGTEEYDEDADDWSRPNDADYRKAAEALAGANDSYALVLGLGAYHPSRLDMGDGLGARPSLLARIVVARRSLVTK